MANNHDCSGCAFWTCDEAWRANESYSVDFHGSGRCRRFPPTPLPDPDYDEMCQYPVTGSHEWCGEWQAAMDLPVADRVTLGRRFWIHSRGGK